MKGLWKTYIRIGKKWKNPYSTETSLFSPLKYVPAPLSNDTSKEEKNKSGLRHTTLGFIHMQKKSKKQGESEKWRTGIIVNRLFVVKRGDIILNIYNKTHQVHGYALQQTKTHSTNTISFFFVEDFPQRSDFLPFPLSQPIPNQST
jgi:hypothetical protein